MHELHGDVLCVGGGRTVPEGQQPSPRKETPGHLAALLGQTSGLGLEEGFEDRVASEQPFPAPGGKRARVRLSVRVYEIHAPALPRPVQEPATFENNQ